MGELRKRHIVQIALLYLGAGWLFIEIADFIVAEYGFSRKILDTVVLLAILGFPAFLVIGWFHGERGHQRVQRGEIWLLTTLGVLGAIGTYRIATAEPAGDSSPIAADSIAAPEVTGDGRLAADDTPTFDGPSLAVVPFTNNLADEELAWLGPGVADLFTTNFAQLAWLRVVGRQRLYDLLMEEGRGEEERIPEGLASTVARAAGAEMMLWGTISGTAEDLVIDAQVIELETGAVRAAERLRGSDVFALVDSLTTHLLDRLRVGSRPRPTSRVRVSSLGTKDMEALEAYQRGVSFERQGLHDQAFAEFERSVAMDSMFMLPALRLAAHTGESLYSFREEGTGGVVPRSGDAVSAAGERSARDRGVAPGDREDRSHRDRVLTLIRRLGDRYEIDLKGLSAEAFVFKMDSTLERALAGIEVAIDTIRRPPPPPE